MKIPSQNLLNMALSQIHKQTMTYIAFTGRTTAANGTWTPAYASPVTVQGSFQPIPRRLYEQMGLQFQGDYAWIFIPQDVIDITRDVAGDQFTFNGKTWKAESKTAWAALDGWVQVLCVAVP